MNILHLMKELVDDSGIPVKKIAYDACMNENTFKNKINPNSDTHHVYLEDIDSIVKALNTDAIAHYFAEQRGLMCVKKMNFNKISDEAIHDLRLIADEKIGEYAKEVRLAMADGHVDFHESVRVQKKFDEMIAAETEYQSKFNQFMAVCEEMNSRKARK